MKQSIRQTEYGKDQIKWTRSGIKDKSLSPSMSNSKLQNVCKKESIESRVDKHFLVLWGD